MWILEKGGFSAGPLVLGIVLGPIAEENFVYGYSIAVAGTAPSPTFSPEPSISSLSAL